MTVTDQTQRAAMLLAAYRTANKPGAMEKWGIGYQDVLSKRFPTLIHARISGFGAGIGSG